MAALLRAAALLACVAVLLCPGARALQAVGGHEEACGAAFGVLRRCAAISRQHPVQDRCCSLLAAFKRNGCMCPDCPEGASMGGTSSKGMLLAAELTDLLDTCEDEAAGAAGGSSQAAAATQQQLPLPTQQVQQAQQGSAADEDEDDLMADMAGMAAWSQDPRHLSTGSGSGSSGQAGLAAGQQQAAATMLDGAEGDYDGMLSDADAAFMLVDPAAARTYAQRALGLAARLAADMAAHSTAAAEAAARGAAAFAAASDQGAEQEEAAASAAAVTDDTSELAAGLGAEADSADVAADASSLAVLADPQAVLPTPESRRADGLASALESEQEQHLIDRLLLLRPGSTEGAEPDVRYSISGDGSSSGGSKAGGAVNKFTLDVMIDADNAASAQRMVQGLISLLKSWRPTSSSRSVASQELQAKLALALQAAAAKAAAAAGNSPLGRSGLQPKQLLVEEIEEEGTQRLGGAAGRRREPKMCACMQFQLAELDGPESGAAAVLYRHYISARLALCRFACQHQQKLAVLLCVELVLCVVWMLLWASRSSSGGAGDDDVTVSSGSSGDAVHAQLLGKVQGQAARKQQFLIVSAADPEWQQDLKRPLL